MQVHEFSSSHSDNRKNNFGSFGLPEKNLVLVLLKETHNFV